MFTAAYCDMTGFFPPCRDSNKVFELTVSNKTADTQYYSVCFIAQAITKLSVRPLSLMYGITGKEVSYVYMLAKDEC